MYRWARALPPPRQRAMRHPIDDVDFERRTLIIRDVKHPRKSVGNDQKVPLRPATWKLLERTPRVDERTPALQIGQRVGRV